LQHLDELETHKTNIEKEILRLAQQYPYQLELLQTVPGFSGNIMTAIALISEIGADMSVFPSAKHLVSWAGCCPRNDQSSKNVKSTRISRAGVYLKPLLVQVANAIIKSDKYPECKERYRRIKARRGHKKAIIAVCRMLLTAIWNILSKLEPYRGLAQVTNWVKLKFAAMNLKKLATWKWRDLLPSFRFAVFSLIYVRDPVCS